MFVQQLLYYFLVDVFLFFLIFFSIGLKKYYAWYLLCKIKRNLIKILLFYYSEYQRFKKIKMLKFVKVLVF